MPKVTPEYTEQKRSELRRCALEIISAKPLASVTMRDVIKRAGISQGGIYIYYSNIDELLLDTVNCLTADISLFSPLNAVLIAEADCPQALRAAFRCVCDYLIAVFDRIGGKLYYELLTSYAFDEKKVRELLPRLLIKQNIMYFQQQTVNKLFEGIQSGNFSPRVPPETLIAFVGAAFDGITADYALYAANNIEEWKLDPYKMFDMLADSIIYFAN